MNFFFRFYSFKDLIEGRGGGDLNFERGGGEIYSCTAVFSNDPLPVQPTKEKKYPEMEGGLFRLLFIIACNKVTNGTEKFKN